MTKLTAAFCNSANVPKNEWRYTSNPPIRLHGIQTDFMFTIFQMLTKSIHFNVYVQRYVCDTQLISSAKEASVNYSLVHHKIHWEDLEFKHTQGTIQRKQKLHYCNTVPREATQNTSMCNFTQKMKQIYNTRFQQNIYLCAYLVVFKAVLIIIQAFWDIMQRRFETLLLLVHSEPPYPNPKTDVFPWPTVFWPLTFIIQNSIMLQSKQIASTLQTHHLSSLEK